MHNIPSDFLEYISEEIQGVGAVFDNMRPRVYISFSFCFVGSLNYRNSPGSMLHGGYIRVYCYMVLTRHAACSIKGIRKGTPQAINVNKYLFNLLWWGNLGFDWGTGMLWEDWQCCVVFLIWFSWPNCVVPGYGGDEGMVLEAVLGTIFFTVVDVSQYCTLQTLPKSCLMTGTMFLTCAMTQPRWTLSAWLMSMGSCLGLLQCRI